MSEPTIKDAIEKTIRQVGGRADLHQIYDGVTTLKTLKSKTPLESIRSDLYRGIEAGRFVQNSDGTYSIPESQNALTARNVTQIKLKEHDVVIDSLSEICKGYLTYQPGQVHKEEIFPKPALIPVGKGDHVLFTYMPDLWVKRKDRRFDIYEVWDSEDDAKAFFEVFRVAYTPDVHYYHVVCVNRGDGSWTKIGAIRQIKAVLNNVKEAGIDYGNRVTVAEVDLETMKDSGKLRASLMKQLQF